MKWLKRILALLSSIFLCGLVITDNIKYAIGMLISSGTALGILLYEFIKKRNSK